MFELKGRSWSGFFREPYTRILLYGENPPNEDHGRRSKRPSHRGHVMRMPGVEMGQYGILPETDPFTVIVCDLCKAAVKPQGLRKHIHRHNTVESTTSALNSLITPCSVSVNALKFDPRADNSNSSTSSVVGGSVGSCEASSSSSSSHQGNDGTITTTTPAAATAPAFHVHDFMGSDDSSTTLPTPVPASLASHRSSVGGSKPSCKASGALKIKLTKTVNRSNSPPNSVVSVNYVTEANKRAPSQANEDSGVLGHVAIPEEGNVRSNRTQGTPTNLSELPPTKKLGLKEREYDPNKHCGVILVDTGKHCTRTLTCKSHALSLRRQVPGRREKFDKLLSDHRAMRALLAGGKIPPLPLPPLPPPPPEQVALSSVVHNTVCEPATSVQPNLLKRELVASESQGASEDGRLPVDQPPSKKLHMDMNILHHSRRSTETSSNQVVVANKMKLEATNGGAASPPEVEDRKQPFRAHHVARHKHRRHDQQQQHVRSNHSRENASNNGRFGPKPIQENGFHLHGSAQLVDGGYFDKGESRMDEPTTALSRPLPLVEDDEASDRWKTCAAPPSLVSSLTVPLTMLGNVLYVNGRNCILETAAADTEKSGQGGGQEHQVFEGAKGRHVEAVDMQSGERRRYLTLSSGRQQRATNRLRLNVIRTMEEEKVGGGYKREEEAAGEFPGIERWYSQIPKPTYANCFKLCKLGTSSAVLSRRYLNIRKSLIMNMVSGGGLVNMGSALNRSPSTTGSGRVQLGGGTAGMAGAGVDKVCFNVERIKV